MIQHLTGRGAATGGAALCCLLACLVGAGGLAAPAQAAPTPGPDPERLKIGLVLSGGGARALAHVGVLEVLEELRIPIDYIAGTSMGAVVGGMYAAGLSPEEIEREMLALDWDDLLRGRPPRRLLSFRRKEDDLRNLFGLELGLGPEGLVLPRGAISTSAIDFVFRSHTLRVAHLDDFDHLPIPFRAVAADLATGEQVVLAGGDLPEALRASLSIPGVFAPVALDGRILVDGSILDNLPVDVVREMGADLVLAVDVGMPLLPAERLDGLTEILGQVMTVASERRAEEQRARADVLITPELDDFGQFSFTATAELFAAGERAARARADDLAALSAPGRFAAWRAGQRREPVTPPPIVVLSIDGASRVDERLIRARIESRPGEPLDLEVLERDLERILQLGEFEAVAFDLVPTTGGQELVIRVTEKRWGPSYLRFGLGLADDLEGSNRLEALISHTWLSLNRLGAEWRNELQVGQSRRAFTELYQPLDRRGRWFVAPSFEHREEVTDLYVDGRKIAEYDARLRTAGIDLGRAFGPFGEARLGLRRGDAAAEATVGVAGLPDVDVDVGGITGRLIFDRLDNAAFPRRGFLASVGAFVSEPALGADDAYTKLAASYSGFVTRGDHTVFLSLAGGGGVDGDLPPYDQLLLGGLFSLSGYAAGELRGEYLGLARPGYLYRLTSLPLGVESAVYLGGWLEAGNVWASSGAVSLDDLRYAVTLAAGADTPLGPLYFAYGLAEEDRSRFYLVLGRRF